ncbi:MAG TPA: VOC family protein [Thermoanaerobaculia bacterium]|jgi:PhnB protein
MATVKPIPDGYEMITPYISVHDGNAAIEFYKNAFDATEVMRMPGEDGVGVGHADLLLFGRMHLMLADEHPKIGFRGPRTLGGSPVLLHVYVEDVDAVVEKAVAAGAKLVRPVADQFYGDRAGGIEDPFGHQWHFATQKEIISEEEMAKRAQNAH